MHLPISTTTNCELLNSQILYNNILCVAVSGGMMVCGKANYRTAQMFDGENFDKFDESKLSRQNFPYQYFTFQ